MANEDSDWLDYVEIKDTGEHEVPNSTEETVCCGRSGHGIDRRTVPRLPLAAMIHRMKILEDASRKSGRHSSGRGRARVLQDRAKSSKPHGLHQRKLEKVDCAEKLQVATSMDTMSAEAIAGATAGATAGHDRKTKADVYSENFPSLGTEHTVNGSPKKRIRHAVNGSQDCKIKEADNKDRNFTENDETVTTEFSHRTELPVECLDPIEIQAVKFDVVKAKNEKIPKKPFNFTKANQELLVEFPIARQSHKIYSLTQHNVEKFLRESDSERSYSSQYLTSHKSTQDNLEGLPVYQRYAVTLDDIKKTKVPSKVKGHLANLLESMENYCKSPDDEKIPNVEAANSTIICDVPSNRNFDSVASNVSDLSNLSSPSDNVDYIDGDVDPIAETVNTDYQNDVKMCDGESHDDGDEDKCNKMETDEENNQPICINKSSQNEVQLNCITDNVKEIKHLDANFVHSLKVSDRVRHDTPVGQLDNIDIKSPPVDDKLEDNCMKNDSLEGLPKVVSKRSKRRTPPKDLKGIPGDQTVWRLYGNNVLQVDGLPAKCDFSVLHDMVVGFGTVLDYQLRQLDTGSSVRFKLHSQNSCEYAVQCLHDTDCLYPDSNCMLSCHQLET